QQFTPSVVSLQIVRTGPYKTLKEVEHAYDLTIPEWQYQDDRYQLPGHILRLPRWRLKPTLIVRYDSTRSRTENLVFSVSADTQAIPTGPAGEAVQSLSFSSSELTAPVDPGGAMPIGDVRYGSYFTRDRGAASLEYLICVARARLLSRARTVFVDFEVPFA